MDTNHERLLPCLFCMNWILLSTMNVGFGSPSVRTSCDTIFKVMHMKCQMSVGRLVSRPCGKDSEFQCPQCGIFICLDHFNIEQKLCLICVGDEIPSGIINVSDLLSFDVEELKIFDSDKQFDVSQEYLDS